MSAPEPPAGRQDASAATSPPVPARSVTARSPKAGTVTTRSPKAGPVTVPRLYAIADGDVLELALRGPGAVVDAVQAMADAGVRWIQLRLKRADDRTRYEIVEACRKGLEDSDVVLWIDDRADLAALVADGDLEVGLHLGQRDLSPGAARRVVGERTWIGLSCHDLAQVEVAEKDADVDVVAVGPVYPTRSKEHPDPVIGLPGVAAARRATAKPLVAIGGIDGENAVAVLDAGADAVVVLGALCRGDVAANSRRMVAALGHARVEHPQVEHQEVEVAR